MKKEVKKRTQGGKVHAATISFVLPACVCYLCYQHGVPEEAVPIGEWKLHGPHDAQDEIVLGGVSAGGEEETLMDGGCVEWLQ